MTGIIDIGSNNIRLVIYEKGHKIENYALNSEIINDTQDGILTPAGTVKLCGMIEFLKEKAGKCRIFAFATFAFRVLKNCEEVKNEIYRATGIEVDVLSGEDEAKYVFDALIGSIKRNESGIGVDLGGGSAEILVFENGKLEFFGSYPIGCRKLKNTFLKGNFPEKEEQKELEKYIKKTLPELKTAGGKLYMMGGTAKTAAKLYAFLNCTENIDILKAENLDGIIRFIKETPEEVMKNVLKKRYDSIVTGIIIMKTIAEICGAAEIHIKKCGVRDGYLKKTEK